MEVDNELEAVLSGPGDRVLEVRELALDVGLAGSDFKRPIADREAHMIQAVEAQIDG